MLADGFGLTERLSAAVSRPEVILDRGAVLRDGRRSRSATVSFTDQVIDAMSEWQNRPLDPNCVGKFVDPGRSPLSCNYPQVVSTSV